MVVGHDGCLGIQYLGERFAETVEIAVQGPSQTVTGHFQRDAASGVRIVMEAERRFGAQQ